MDLIVEGMFPKHDFYKPFSLELSNSYLEEACLRYKALKTSAFLHFIRQI